MLTFDQWTLEAIRAEGSAMSWFEERRFEWIVIIKPIIEAIVQGKIVILVCDAPHEWFVEYIRRTLNKPPHSRPLIPNVRLSDLYPYYDEHSTELVHDMLDLTFKGGYTFWYIGRGDDPHAQILTADQGHFLWMMDTDRHHVLTLTSYDLMLDRKLLQLYGLFDRTLNAVLFGEIDVDH